MKLNLISWSSSTRRNQTLCGVSALISQQQLAGESKKPKKWNKNQGSNVSAFMGIMKRKSLEHLELQIEKKKKKTRGEEEEERWGRWSRQVSRQAGKSSK